MAAIVVNATLPNSASVKLTDEDGRVTDAWYNFFQNLFLRTGGATGDASIILDTLGDVQGGMLARFAEQWNEFVATEANSIPVLNPLADADLKTITEILDLIGALPGKGLFRDTVEWKQGPVIELNVVAAGSNQGDATSLIGQWAQVGTVGALEGVKLHAIGAGNTCVVYNDGGNSLKVYPQVGGTIDSLGGNNPYNLAVSKSQTFRQISNTLWRSTQLG